MNSEQNRLNPEITDIAALRRLAVQINDAPGGLHLPQERLENLVIKLATHFGLALDTAKRAE